MVSQLKKHLTHQLNHLIYLRLFLSSGLVRFSEPLHQPHRTSLCNHCVTIYIFSCINAYRGLFYHHLWYQCLNESKDVQIRLIYVPVSNGYLQFFLLSPPDAGEHQSERPGNLVLHRKSAARGGKKKKSTGSV